MNITSLPPAERDAAIAGFTTDVWRVVRWVARHRDYPVHTHTPIAALRRLSRRELPDLDTLDTLCGWVIFQTDFDARVRPLTESESQIRATALRLADAIAATRHSVGDPL